MSTVLRSARTADFLASASRDQKVRVWDAATGRELVTLKGHTDYVNGVAFSPDGRRLASGGGDNVVKVWDAATGQELATLTGHAVGITGVAFSPDGRRLASGSLDDTVRIWDTETRQELIALKDRAGSVFSVAFGPDGRSLAAANQDGSISVWETLIPPDVRERRAADAAARLANPTTPSGICLALLAMAVSSAPSVGKRTGSPVPSDITRTRMSPVIELHCSSMSYGRTRSSGTRAAATLSETATLLDRAGVSILTVTSTHLNAGVRDNGSVAVGTRLFASG
jgi:hypothetical protein